MRVGILRREAVPEAFLSGRVVLPLVALWIAFSCSRWFGLPKIYGLPDITADRVALVGLAAYAVVVFSMRKRPAGLLVRSEAALWLLVVLAAMSGVIFGGFTSGYPGARISNLWNFLLFPAMAYSLLLRTKFSDRDLARLCLILTLFGAYLGATAILERTTFARLLLPPAIGDPTIPQHWGRSRGPFLQAEFNATVMAQLLPIALYLVAAGGHRARLVAGITIPLLCMGVYFTETRAAMLSLALVVLGGAVMRHPSRRAYRLLTLALIIGALTLIASGSPLVPRWSELPPLYDRANLFLVTVGMIVAHPALGIGFSNFDLYQWLFFLRPQALQNLSATPHAEFWAGGTHNTWLTPLAELGLVTGGLYLGMLLWQLLTAFRGAWGNERSGAPNPVVGLPLCVALVGLVFLVNATFVELRYTATPNLIFWAFAALFQQQRYAHPSHARQTSSSHQVPRPSHGGRGDVLLP